ncbi:MAG: UvrD-helicase domain-containing protein, partial [Candidatus Doudnabacteria bacterium]|nr:UvrD-helicase domain-containing protein [Candidatus Doudnabacteria bacterium]
MTQATKLEIKAKSKVLEGLNKEQIEAVTHSEGPVLIVAGAGTGKTTVITRRIAYLIEQGIKPEEILALAFGEKAALEMEERVDQLLPFGYYNLQISTFHSFGEKLIREYGLEIGLPDFKVLDEVGQWLLVRNNLEKFQLDYYRPLGNPTRFIKALVSHFSRAKDELITPEEYLEYAEKLKLSKDAAESGAEFADDEAKRIEEVANAYHVYQKLLLESSFLDFGDLINYSLKILKDRPLILEKLRRRYKYILIDEFQDTNYAQYQLIRILSEPLNNITVVGDDDQSIFKFRGASISNILHFQKDYPNAKFISLTKNYRSGQKILDLAYEFIKQNDPDRLESKLSIDKKLKSTLKSKGIIEAFVAEDYISEAALVGEKISQLRDQNPQLTWNDFAILARSHDALDPFINAFDRRGLPYIYFANRGLYHKPIILDSIAYLRLLDDYHDSASLYRVLNFPTPGISPKAIVELSHHAKKKALSLYEAAKQ